MNLLTSSLNDVDNEDSLYLDVFVTDTDIWSFVSYRLEVSEYTFKLEQRKPLALEMSDSYIKIIKI